MRVEPRVPARSAAGRSVPAVRAMVQPARDEQVQPNPDAMVVASATPRRSRLPRESCCASRLIAKPGYVVFFTNYDSRKGREIEANPRVAAVLHWDTLNRRCASKGRVVRSPAAESDEYFASRALDSRIGAWASLQSEPLESRATSAQARCREAARYGTPVPRPPHWGGYRLWPDAVELWVEGAFRVHDRARWTRIASSPKVRMHLCAAPGRRRGCFPDHAGNVRRGHVSALLGNHPAGHRPVDHGAGIRRRLLRLLSPAHRARALRRRRADLDRRQRAGVALGAAHVFRLAQTRSSSLTILLVVGLNARMSRADDGLGPAVPRDDLSARGG